MTYAEYEAVRAHAMQCFDDSKCPALSSLPLLTLGVRAPGGAPSYSVVVVNANAVEMHFSLVDADGGGRFSPCTIPALSVQTYTF